MRFPICVLAVAVLASACATSPDAHPLTESIWLPGEGRFADEAEVVSRMVAAEVVLLGETHDNPRHQALQGRIVERLAAAGKVPAVVYEMIDGKQAPALARHLAAHPGDADGVGAAVSWNDIGWPAWGRHVPAARAALTAGGTILAGNIDRDSARAIARREAGAIPEFPPLSAQAEAALREDVRTGHCNMMPDSALAPMLTVQRLRDATMAGALLEGLTRPGATASVLIAGSGHVRRDFGVPQILAARAPQRKVFSLAFIETRDRHLDSSDYEGLEVFDAVWFTVRVEREDPCEGLRRQMHGKE